MGAVAVTAAAVGLLAGYIWCCLRIFDRLVLAMDKLIDRLLDRRRADIRSRTEAP